MHCPNCAGDLKNHEFNGRFAQKIKLKKCDNCHGFWLKNFSLFDLPEEICLEIDQSTHNQVNYDKKLYCPKCSEELDNFTNYNIPSSLHFKVCHSCSGVWSYAGKIAEFKNLQIHGRENSSKISSQMRFVLTMTFSFLFALMSYFNFALQKDEFNYSAAEQNQANPILRTNQALATEGVIFLLLIGTILILWGKYRKLGWILNFCALFVIIFYIMLQLTQYYTFFK